MAKRILILSTVHPLGHPRHSMKLGRGLAEAGFHVELWGRGEPLPGFPENVTFHALTHRGKWARMLDLPAALWRGLFGGHDLVIVVPPETVPVGILLTLFGKKVLWDVEEDSGSAIEHSDWLPQPLRGPIAAVFRWVELLAARLLPAVTLAEDGYLPRFENYNRLEVIHNYPPRPDLSIDPSRGELAEQRWQTPGPRLIYVGMVTEHRGLVEAIQTVALLEERFPGIRLDVVGDIPQPSYRKRIEAVQSKLKTPTRIHLHGKVPFDELAGYLNKAQIGILPLWPQPNHRVSLQTKLFEYALSGLPTIVGDIPLWRTLIDASDSGEAAAPRDPKAWAEAILRLWARGPKELKAAGERAHDLVIENNWFWDVERDRLAALCRDVIASRPVRR